MGMLDRARKVEGTAKERLKVALNAGSSNPGKMRRAPLGSRSVERTQRRPFGVYVHGNNDVDGALLAIDRIVAGLGWRAVHEPVRVVGSPEPADLDACWDLGATVAATLV